MASRFIYQSFHINKSQPLGHGSYGAVYKAKCDQLPCAAKVLHPTIVDPTDPGAGKIMERFQQECIFLESIRHPNVVQYLGMTRDPESRLPVLLMELLDESLTKMLERSQQSLSYYVQVDICHDIALAVTYLHSNDIIHRDLSSNNVLMFAGRRAKVTDFGMSKLTDATPSMTFLTICPGTQAYMPPETLREPPRYTKKLDCFSEGVIMIQVCTQLWPEPGPRNKLVPDSRSPTGSTEMPVLETERRKSHIDLINPSHKLLPIAMDCLHYQESERPSCEELCQRLADLKDSREYRENVHQQQDEIFIKENQIVSFTEQLRDKDYQLQQLQEQNREHQNEIALQASELQWLKQHLEENEQVTAKIQMTNHSLKREVEQLQKQLSQQGLRPPQPPPIPPKSKRQLQETDSQKNLLVQLPPPVGHKPHSHIARKLTLNWKDNGNAPFEIDRGVSVVDGNVVYFMNLNGGICSYNSTTKSWCMFQKYPYQYGSLVVINGQLTAIGGCMNMFTKDTYTNKLLSLRKKWTEVYPPMITKRRGMTAVTSKEHLIVAGGVTGAFSATCISTVEAMAMKTQTWSTVTSLPCSYSRASGTICGDQLYMLGGWDDMSMTNLVLTCSLSELLQSSSSSSSSSVWHRVADAPAYSSTCAAVNGELLVVGGRDKKHKPTASVHKYNPTTNLWDLISNMPTVRCNSYVAVFPTNDMMVVGGIYYQSKVVMASINIS